MSHRSSNEFKLLSFEEDEGSPAINVNEINGKYIEVIKSEGSLMYEFIYRLFLVLLFCYIFKNSTRIK